MRGLVLVVVLLVLGLGGYIYISLPEPVKSVVAGDVAPDFQLEDTNGNQVSLSSLRGKVVLVNFMGHLVSTLPGRDALDGAAQ